MPSSPGWFRDLRHAPGDRPRRQRRRRHPAVQARAVVNRDVRQTLPRAGQPGRQQFKPGVTRSPATRSIRGDRPGRGCGLPLASAPRWMPVIYIPLTQWERPSSEPSTLSVRSAGSSAARARPERVGGAHRCGPASRDLLALADRAGGRGAHPGAAARQRVGVLRRRSRCSWPGSGSTASRRTP